MCIVKIKIILHINERDNFFYSISYTAVSYGK